MTTFAFGQGLPMTIPEQVGVSAERIERIRPVMQGYIDKGNLPGLLTAVARRGKISKITNLWKQIRSSVSTPCRNRLPVLL